MIKRESVFAIKFRHWIKANPMYNCTFEHKDTRDKNYFPFSELKQKQIDWALAVKSDKGVLMRNIGGSGEPDYNYYRNAFAWIVIKYPKGFVIIDIDTFLIEKESSKRKSLTWDRALKIATIEVLT